MCQSLRSSAWCVYVVLRGDGPCCLVLRATGWLCVIKGWDLFNFIRAVVLQVGCRWRRIMNAIGYEHLFPKSMPRVSFAIPNVYHWDKQGREFEANNRNRSVLSTHITLVFICYRLFSLKIVDCWMRIYLYFVWDVGFSWWSHKWSILCHSFLHVLFNYHIMAAFFVYIIIFVYIICHKTTEFGIWTTFTSNAPVTYFHILTICR